MIFGILGALGYVGMNAAAYVATGAAQAKGEAKGKAPINPLLKFVLGCIFWPALLLRKILPIEGTQNWRAKFKKQVRRKQNKFERNILGTAEALYVYKEKYQFYFYLH